MSDEVPESEQPEIIPKPPSHPITTSLLIVSFFGVILCIALVWAELFGQYLYNDRFNDKSMDKHGWNATKTKQGPIDHYDLDFPGEKDIRLMEYNVKKELKLVGEETAQ